MYEKDNSFKTELIKEFEEAYGDMLTQFQKDQIRYIRATNVMSKKQNLT